MRAAELAKNAASALGVSQAVADDLVRLYVDDQLGRFSALHYSGSVYDLPDLTVAATIPELRRLLHAEKCQALQVLACLLRSAQDDEHPRSPQCRELAQQLLSQGLDDHLWQLFDKVSSCPKFSASPERAEVLSCVHQGLDLQLCVLECLALCHRDTQLRAPSPEMLCRMASLFKRQYFLGSLPQAVRAHAWLLSDSELCERAQCVGDLSLTVFLGALALEDTEGDQLERHPLLSDCVENVQHVHKLLSSEWADLCERASDNHGGTLAPAVRHCAQMASIGLLGWVALLAAAPADYRERYDLGIDKLISCVTRSQHLVEAAVDGLLARGFVTRDAPNREHSAVRALLRSFVGAVATRLRLDRAPGLQLAMSRMMRAAHDGEVATTLQFWSEEYPEGQGCAQVLHTWLGKFPNGLEAMLELIGGLVGARGEDPAPSLYALELLCSPLRSVLLPYQIFQHAVEVVASEAAPGAHGGARVVLQEPVYIEEAILHAHGLCLPEWHVPACTTLQAGAEGFLLSESAGSARARHIRWQLRGSGLSTWRVALTAWDAALEALGYADSAPARPLAPEAPAARLLPAVLRCVCPLLVANPSAHAGLVEALPADELEGEGLLSRLLASLFACAAIPALGSSLLPLILRALAAVVTAQPIGAVVPPSAVLLRLLEEGCPRRRFRTRGASALVALLVAALERERGAGAFPATLAALGLIESLLRACSAELFAVPWAHHALVVSMAPGAPLGEVNVPPQPLPEPGVQGIGTLSALLDFVFGRCFASCSFWACHVVSSRWQVSLACIRVAKALLPALECFNWPPSAELAVHLEEGCAGASNVGGAVRSLRALQLCVLRCWSEASFVPTLLHHLVCDVVFGPAGGDGGGQFVGFSSPALEDGSGLLSGAPEPGYADVGAVFAGAAAPVVGAQLVSAALSCLRGVLALVIRPAGFAPHYAPLLHHLIDITSAREPLSTHAAEEPGAVGGAGLPSAAPQRACLVQSLYAHIRGDDPVVGELAAGTLTAVCALWSRADLRLPRMDGQLSGAAGDAATSGPRRRALLLAHLGVPSSPAPLGPSAEALSLAGTPSGQEAPRRPTSLAPHLASHLVEVLGDSARTPTHRCASAELARASLAMRPGLLFLDDRDPDLVPRAFTACGRALLDLLPNTDDKNLAASASAAASPGASSAPPTCIEMPGVTDRRFEGVVNFFDEGQGYGFIACEEMQKQFGADVLLQQRQRGGHEVGQQVSFAIYLTKAGKPRAKELMPAAYGSTPLLLAVLGLLEDLAASGEASALCAAFARPVEAACPGSGQRSATLWHVLSRVLEEVLLPWSCGRRLPGWAATAVVDEYEAAPLHGSEAPLLAAATVLRLAERCCEAAGGAPAPLPEEARAALTALLGVLLGPGLDLLLPEAPQLSRGAPEQDFDMMAHPFGPALLDSTSSPASSRRAAKVGALEDFTRARDSATRFSELMARCHLSAAVLDPAGASAAGFEASALLARGVGAASCGDPAARGLPVLGAGPGGDAGAGAFSADEASSAMTAAGLGLGFSAAGETRAAPVPAAFRWWADLVELACGAAVARAAVPATSGREALRAALQPERLGTFGGIGETHSGSASMDAYIVGAPLRPFHVPSLRLLLACAGAGSTDLQARDLRAVLGECARLSSSKAAIAARVLTVEALDDLVRSAARLARAERQGTAASKAQEMLAPVLMGLAGRIFHVLHEHLDLLADHAHFFARAIALLAHLLAAPPHGSALLAPSQVVSALGCAGNSSGPQASAAKELLQRETPVGLALARELVSTLRACGQRLRHAAVLPPPAAALLAGAAFAGSNAWGHADAAVACLSVLMLLVPALRHAPALAGAVAGFGGGASTEAAANSFEASALLAELLQVLAELLDCLATADKASGNRALEAANTDARGAAVDATAGLAGPRDAHMEIAGPQPGWPARALVARPGIEGSGSSRPGGAGVQVLRSPADALGQSGLATRAKALDHALKSGVHCLVLAVAERAVAALCARATSTFPRAGGGGGRFAEQAAAVLKDHMLPRLLSCSNIVFSPSLDRHRISLGAFALGARPGVMAPMWDRAVEAAWASHLNSVLSVLLAVSQTPEGSVSLAEHRCFALLAYCPLLHASVLPPSTSAGGAGHFPAAYSWPASGASGAGGAFRGGFGALAGSGSGSSAAVAWRRPLHGSWCRTLLLVASMLASAPQLSAEAAIFLEAYAPRLRYLFRNGLQLGHMALLEEAAAACRMLALMSQRSGLAESLLADAATQSFIFVLNTCLTDRSAPSEVFLPASGAEFLGAQPLASSSDAPASVGAPAAVPSIFHQRVEYLALDFLRNLLVALLRAASSPTWLRHVAAAGAALPTAPTAPGWPVAPSLLGFGAAPGAPGASGVAFAGEAGQLRLWAAVMDVALEGARRVVEILEGLHKDGHENLLLASSVATAPSNAAFLPFGALAAAGKEERLWVPLSLALTPLEPEVGAQGTSAAAAGGHLSPGALARGLSPPPITPRSPPRKPGSLFGPGPPGGERDVAGQAERKRKPPSQQVKRCRHLALKPGSAFGGQAPLGVIPECVSVDDLRQLCSSILEMACTLICHFCQATRSSILTSTDAGAAGAAGTASERSAPAASVLHGLLSFLHELRSPAALGALGLHPAALDYLTRLDNHLRSWQQLGPMPDTEPEAAVAFDGLQ